MLRLYGMFPGSPAPLRPTVSLLHIAKLAWPGEVLGAWIRGCRRTCRLRLVGVLGHPCIHAGPDLGALLHRCRRVVVWDDGLQAVESSRLIRCRVLQIMLGTPYLPPPAQLRALYPSLQAGEGTIALPIGLGSAEEALSLCVAEKVPVAGSRIEYRAFSG
jgi:hypothetical protein